MTIILTKDELSKHRDKYQDRFNLMIESAKVLAKDWLESGFNVDLIHKNPDFQMATEENKFITSQFYTFYEELLPQVTLLSDLPTPNKAFKLFIGGFNVNVDTHETIFEASNLILFFNWEIGQHVKDLFFNADSVIEKDEMPALSGWETNLESLTNSSIGTTYNIQEDIHPLINNELKKEYHLNTILENPSPSKDGGKEKVPETVNTYFDNISFSIISGFMIGFGASTIAMAFLLLNAASLSLPGIILGVTGGVSLLGGLSLFSLSWGKNESAKDVPTNSIDIDNFSYIV